MAIFAVLLCFRALLCFVWVLVEQLWRHHDTGSSVRELVRGKPVLPVSDCTVCQSYALRHPTPHRPPLTTLCMYAVCYLAYLRRHHTRICFPRQACVPHHGPVCGQPVAHPLPWHHHHRSAINPIKDSEHRKIPCAADFPTARENSENPYSPFFSLCGRKGVYCQNGKSGRGFAEKLHRIVRLVRHSSKVVIAALPSCCRLPLFRRQH